ncbi:MAG TPA: FkbM family methyltransferase [Actinomycetota bacterium]|nr:FkbM family methyltransferase [Actinomycetota bacterium]
MEIADSYLASLAWRIMFRLDRLVGMRAARVVVAGLLRMISWSPSGYVRTTYRLVERRDVAPDIARIPSLWWTRAPTVSVKRLGLRFVLDLRDNLQRVLFFAGVYEPAVLGRILSELSQGAVYVDGGAHVGVHALPVSKALGTLGGGRVYAVEPNEEASNRLREAAHANGLAVEIVPFALSDLQRTLTLRSDERYADADLGVLSAYGTGDKIVQVKATTFDDWAEAVRLERLDIVKLDVEGSEGAALAGMSRTLRRLRPGLVIVETKEASLRRAGGTADEIHSFLRDHGYTHEATVPFSNAIFVLT